MYADEALGHSRRDLLRRGLALIGAAIGVRAIGEVDGLDLGSAWTILGENFYLSRPAGSGALPQRGDRATGSGTLVNGAGEPIGSFYATRIAVEVPGVVGVAAPSAFEWQSLNLPGGSIFGTGVASHNVDLPDQFSIVGGTGRYTGASGSYAALLRPRELGGDGTAEFMMSVTSGRR